MNKIKCLVMASGVAFVQMSVWAGGDLVVNTATTLSETADYDNAAIHANVTINNAASIAITGKVVQVGSEVGESPVISISGNASLLTQHLKSGGNAGNSTHWLWASCVVGENGGSAKFEVAESLGTTHTYTERPTTKLGLWLGGVTISENAAVNNLEQDAIDFLELKAGAWADIAALSNFNAKAARILFNGGKLRMHYAGTRGATYYAPAGKTIELTSVDGKDIWINKSYLSTSLISGGGTLKTSGSGNVVFWEDGYTEGVNKIIQNLYDASYGTIVWAHKGKLLLRHGGVLRLRADDVLPYGAQTGIVELMPSSEEIFPEIDLYGHSAKVNGLVTTGAAFVSNRTTTAGTIVLGNSDYVGGRLSAKLYGNVKVAVRGASANVTIDNTTAPELAVEEGTATFNLSDSTISKITVADGASLVVDGVTLKCIELSVASDESIQVKNGGKIIRGIGSDSTEMGWSELSTLPLDIEKTGSGEYVYHSATVLTNALKVAEGRFTFSSRGYVTNEWWRFTVTASFGGSVCEIGEVCFFDFSMDGTARMTNPSYQEYNMSPAKDIVTYVRGNDATTMANSSVMVPEGDTYGWTTGGSGRVYGDPTSLFDRGGVNKMFSPTLALPKNQTVEYPITVRLAKGRKVGFFSYVNSTYGLYQMPKGWRLETSPDGVNWVTATTYYNSTGTPTTDMLSSSQGFARAGEVFLFDQLTMQHAAGPAPTAQIEVVSGATLDLDYTEDDKAVIGNLQYVLTEGGGTITKFIPAETGYLNLVGAKPAYGNLTLGYTFGTIKNAENIKNWTVALNGVAKKNYHAEIIEGKLVVRVVEPGLVLIVK